jgi:predicted thioesterase
MAKLEPGLIGEVERRVTEEDTAEQWGSGLVPVFGTPSLVGLMENAAVEALKSHLPPRKTSVGGRMNVRHLAPTPVGLRVRARAELVEVDGQRLEFRIEAWDDAEKVGEASHTRFVVSRQDFVERAASKRS